MSTHSHFDAPALAAALGERAEEVCRRYLPKGRRSGRYWSVGNIDGAKGCSMWVRLRPPGTPGKWVDAATREHGDLVDLIHHHVGGASLGPALEEARVFLSLPSRSPPPKTGNWSTADRVAAAQRLWHACRPVDGTHAEAYLRARGIEHCRFPALRFHPELWYRDEAGVRSYPGLVAAVTTNEGEITGVHRTWLDPRTPAKASIAVPRKALGPIYGNAVLLGPAPPEPSKSLVAGEGIETVLSVLTALPKLSGAAALASSILAAFTPPEGVARLLIARDNDAAGEGAAEQLRMRCRELDIPTTVLVPERGDFNDDLLAVGADALRERLVPVLEAGQV